MGFDSDLLEAYIKAHSEKEDELLEVLHRETHLKLYHPRRSTDHLSGVFLQFISQILKPRNILEIGTFSGYGTICLAKGLSAQGSIHSIEINDELESFILANFKKAGITEQVSLHIGNALEVIPTIRGNFDLVFIDGEKSEYLDYYNLVMEKLVPGGLIIADNVLWDGKVLEEQTASNDHFTLGIKAFNDWVQQDERVENLMIPLFDGLMLIRKKS